ncbi:MAG: Fpg/Nei family DNA glycosylase [Micromonosporaceae bacterium]
MPELPDVEAFRALFAANAAGHRVTGVDVADAGVLRKVTPRQLSEALRGRVLSEPARRGKWLIVPTDGPVLLLHFGMTGSLEWSSEGEPRHRHDRVIFITDHGELRFRDMRKLQGITLARDPGEVDRVLGTLGPDALAIGRKDFDALLGERRGAVKTMLIDQEAVSGLGNLLADEILWRAKVHPRCSANKLTTDERRRLYSEMRKVLHAAVRAGRVPPRPSWLTGRRDRGRARGEGPQRKGAHRLGATCPRCETPLSRARIGGRTTVWCPRCQPA